MSASAWRSLSIIQAPAPSKWGATSFKKSISKLRGQLEAKFSRYGFVRCHNAYLVNLSAVGKTVGDEVAVGKDRLPISRARKKEFVEALMAYYGNGGVL